MEEIRIFVENSWKSPARKDGVAMWLAECMRHGEPRTREGFIHLEAGTEAQGTLMALVNAFCILKKPCIVKVNPGCAHVSDAVQNGWHLRWQENGWENAKGRPVKNAGLWKMLMAKAAPHTLTAESGSHEYASVMQDSVKKELKAWKRRKGSGKH